MDSPTDTHRHLSHLVGFYPGYALSNYDSNAQGLNYSADDVWFAVQTSLIHRGNGTGPDADSGWEKAWRAACWAQFTNSSAFYHELTVCILFFSSCTPQRYDIDAMDGMAPIFCPYSTSSSGTLPIICSASITRSTQRPSFK